VLDRFPAAVDVPEGGIATTATSATVHIGQTLDDGVLHALDDNERGLKDTVRVNPNEVVDVVVRFEVFAGRYMYHCHILEHEDRDMMRPFVVMPPELMPFMDMPFMDMRPGGGGMADMRHEGGDDLTDSYDDPPDGASQEASHAPWPRRVARVGFQVLLMKKAPVPARPGPWSGETRGRR
jgi:Multicopper oxidase